MAARKRTRDTTTSAVAIAAYLRLLEQERLEAESSGVIGCDAYMADLEADIAERRVDFICAGVTEIAELRADIDGPLLG
jgi:hypothetical protein